MKFAEMESFEHVVQVPFCNVKESEHPLKGNWHSEFFKNNNPIVLELGCGKGEYTVGLGKRFPEKNFIGIDIKGARMYTGAKESKELQLTNVGFLRTKIEVLQKIFDKDEIAEIWITFPDPQMKKVSKRLTSTHFIKRYRDFLKADGLIHLKSDSNFLYTYTDAMVQLNKFDVQVNTNNLYQSGLADEILGIRTFYEQQWLSRGKTIKYLKFKPHQEELEEPDIEIEYDDYRSFDRNRRQPNN